MGGLYKGLGTARARREYARVTTATARKVSTLFACGLLLLGLVSVDCWGGGGGGGEGGVCGVVCVCVCVCV